VNCVRASRDSHRCKRPFSRHPVRYSQSPIAGDNVGLVSHTPRGHQEYVPSGVEEGEGIPWARYLDVLRRHVILVVAISVVGTVTGIFAARRVEPVYDAQATVWIASGVSQQSGPIRPQQLLGATSWVELLRSYAIIDPVVHKLRLNLSYKVAADSLLFRDFESLPTLRPGAYILKVGSGGAYSLSTSKGVVLERGTVGDPIGRKIGLAWTPDAHLLPAGKVLSFWVSTPRTASLALLSKLRTSLPDDGQFLSITLSGSDPNQTANILNAWVSQFVTSSGDLKKRHLLEFKNILSDQLGVAEGQLRQAESQLERFRVSTITLPSGAPAVSAGTQVAADPSIAGYFQQKGNLGEVQAERVALEQMVAAAHGGPLNPQAFLMLPAVLNNTPQLRAALDELATREAALRTEKQFLTDANPRVKQLSETVRSLQYETIPSIVQNILQTLRARERDLGSRLETQSSELRAIPSRAIEELRLSRQVAASENLYSALKARYEEVSLAEAQTTPDLSVLDFAVPPMHPNSNDGPRLVLLAILASIGLAAGLSLLHDRLDSRFRYPEQAVRDLGLTIAGTVPKLKPARDGEFQVELMSQVIESFRTLRLATGYDFPADRPIVIAVTSPSTGDGKSLVSANLALAFASAGHRTLLIDGDVRRGGLHATFDVPVTPGLVEYLGSGSGMDIVVKPTASENLYLLPRGTRATRAPELLVSAQMGTLIKMARERFEVVIIDSPPFIAGVDAYALSAAAGSVLIVLRQGLSDRKLAAAKLTVLDRLPIRVLGAVINGVPSGGLYRYYGTGYAEDGPFRNPVGSLATPKGLVVNA
jgi:succinoglycan biosynthesis transport protein ExoP